MFYDFFFQQPDQSEIPIPPKEKKFKGYFKIARHYEWALNQIFLNFNFDTAIIVEGKIFNNDVYIDMNLDIFYLEVLHEKKNNK